MQYLFNKQPRASSGNSFVWETGGPMLMQVRSNLNLNAKERLCLRMIWKYSKVAKTFLFHLLKLSYRYRAPMTRLFHWPCNARTIDSATRSQQSTRWAIVNCNCNKGQCDDSQETATKCSLLAIQEMQLNKAFSPRSPSKFSAMPWTCTIPPSTPTEMTWEL